MKKLSLLAVVLYAAGHLAFTLYGPGGVSGSDAGQSDQILAAAFEGRTSNVQVAGEGVVLRNLSDDLDGSRHQRFILRTGTGQTLLVAHNLDLAQRVSDLDVGDTVSFNGEYEWNPEGGVIHWTHRDPAGIHVAGWLKHNGNMYE